MSLATAGPSAVQVWEADLPRAVLVPHSSVAPLDGCVGDVSRRLCWSPSGRVLAEAASHSNAVRLLRTGELRQVSALEIPSLTTGVSSVCFSPNSRMLAVTSGGDAFIWDFKRCQYRHCFSDRSSATVAALFLSRGCLLTASRSGQLRAHPLLQQDDCLNFEQTEVRGGFLSCVASSFTKVVAGFDDGSVRIWDAADGRLLQGTHFHAGGVTSVEFSPKNPRLVMTGGSDSNVSLYDTGMSSGLPSAKVETVRIVHSLSFHPDSVHFAVGLRNGELRIYDWRNSRFHCAATQVDACEGGLEVKFSQNNDVKEARSPDSVAALPSRKEQSESAKQASLTTRRTQQEIPKALSSSVNSELEVQDMYESITDDEISKSETDTFDTQKILNIVKKRQTAKCGDAIHFIQKSTSKDESYAKLQIERSLDRIRMAAKPVNTQDLEEALAMLRYDIHRDIQEMIREQRRQFELAKVGGARFA